MLQNLHKKSATVLQDMNIPLGEHCFCLCTEVHTSAGTIRPCSHVVDLVQMDEYARIRLLNPDRIPGIVASKI